MTFTKILEFLQYWKKDGPWILTAIQTDKKKVMTETFSSESLKELEYWLAANNGKRNIYFHVNEAITALSKKATKEEIKAIRFFHVDVDPEKGKSLDEERERILASFTDKLPHGIPAPSTLVFSGGGYQAFWRLRDPILIDGSCAKAEEAELYNKRLEQVFGGDHCHNCDRIMRLPGTLNIPDAKKIKAGRKEELSYVLYMNDKCYDISEFKKAHDVQVDGNSMGSEDVRISANIERIMDLSELDEYNVPERVKIVIAQGRHPDQPKEGDNSRSAWVFDCVCNLYRYNVPDDIIFSILTDPDWEISSSVLENKNPEKYAIRQMTRAKEEVVDPDLRFMNDRHAVIGNLGGKCRVVEEVEDKILDRSKLTISSFADLQNRYSNRMVEIGQGKKGPTLVPLGKYWLNHKDRRQYDYLRFAPLEDLPGVYNLWKGFSVEPKPNDCSLYLEHIEKVICSGNTNYFDYLIRWMARAVQQPASQGEVAVVMRGGKGVGKGITSKYFGRLFGRHYMQIANPSHLVGQFNSHLRDVVVLFADEAFFAGDKKHESVLKMLITEDTIPIEQKGIDVEISPNYVHLIMASNDPHVVRASGDERRYFLLDVSDQHRQDSEYFSAIVKQMENGGLSGLLYYLQAIDLTGFNVRNVPKTEALVEQKILSLSPLEEWWYTNLTRGHILDSSSCWEERVSLNNLYMSYSQYMDLWNIRARANATMFGKFLVSVLPEYIKRQMDENGKRVYCLVLPPLDVCQSYFERLMGVAFEKPTNPISLHNYSTNENKNLSVF